MYLSRWEWLIDEEASAVTNPIHLLVFAPRNLKLFGDFVVEFLSVLSRWTCNSSPRDIIWEQIPLNLTWKDLSNQTSSFEIRQSVNPMFWINAQPWWCCVAVVARCLATYVPVVKVMPVTQINTSDPAIKLKQMLKDETWNLLLFLYEHWPLVSQSLARLVAYSVVGLFNWWDFLQPPHMLHLFSQFD